MADPKTQKIDPTMTHHYPGPLSNNTPPGGLKNSKIMIK